MNKIQTKLNKIQTNVTFPQIATESLAEFESLASKAIELTRAEVGTLQYEWFFNDSRTACKVLETYEDSNAVLLHFGNVGPLLPRLIDLGGGAIIEVFGTPSREVLEAIARHQPAVFGFFQGK